MKKIQSLILALPLIVAAALVSCSDDNIDAPAPQPELQNTVTFKAIMPPETRVAYNVSGNNAIKCKWDNNDLNKTVKFERTVSYAVSKDLTVTRTITYDFRIISIADGIATLAYTGKAIFPDDYPDTESRDFPEQFTGTATYTAPAAQSQPTTTSTGNHLNNGTILVANLTAAEPGANIQFAHATSVYRIKFKAPAPINASANPKLSIETADGVFGEVAIGFTMTEGSEYTVYLHGDKKGSTDKLTFRLDYEGENNHIVIYAYKNLSANKTLEHGRYYGVDLTNTTPERTEYSNKELYEAMGDAPVGIDVLNIGIPLDEHHKFVNTTDPNNDPKVKYFLYPATDVLRDPSGNILYFYWGETEGHTVNPTNHKLNFKAGEQGTSFTGKDGGYFSYSQNTQYDYTNGYEYSEDAPINLYNPTHSFSIGTWATSIYRWGNLKYISLKSDDQRDKFTYWVLNSKLEVDNPAHEDLIEEIGDPVAKRWGGYWKVPTENELKALFVSAKTSGPTYSSTSGEFHYAFKVYNGSSNTNEEIEIDYPVTSAINSNVSGVKRNTNRWKTGQWPTFMVSAGSSDANTHMYQEEWEGSGKDPYLKEYDITIGWTGAKPYDKAVIEDIKPYCAMYNTSTKTFDVDGMFTAKVYEGLSILPVLVVPAQKAQAQN